MSLLSAVLQVDDETHREELKLQLKDVSKRTSLFVDSVKNFTIDIKEILVSRFVDNLPNKSLEFINFNERKNRLQAEYEELHVLVDKFSNTSSASNRHFRALYDDFFITSNRFKVMSDLAVCSKDLEVANRFLERRQYKKAAKQIENLLDVICQPISYNDLSELVEAMKDVVSLKHARCLYKITALWRERLTWSENVADKEKFILVQINVSDPENMQEILNALSTSKRINVELYRFADFLIQTAMPALMLKKCKITVNNNLNKITLRIDYSEYRDGEEKDSISSILNNLVTYFETIQMNIDCRWEDDRTVFSILGQIAGKQFFTLLKENCLDKIIPTDETLLDAYLPIVQEVTSFTTYLCEIGFMDGNASPLKEYTQDLHNLLYKSKCEKLLLDVRNLMKTNLQEKIVEASINESSDLCVDEMKLLERDNCRDRVITESPFLLPHCCISQSAKDILDLVVRQLKLAVTSSETLANKLIVCVRNIFEMYYMLVPNYHDDVLKNNALDLALFYNNCFYLAHGMLGHPWSKTFPPELSGKISILLTDQVHNMRLAAIIRMATFIRTERQYITNTIAESELGNLDKISSIGSNTTIAISKCLDKLEKLKCYWMPILPINTYEKTMSNLTSCLSKELIQVVMTVKDKVIGENMASELAVEYRQVLERIPQLFHGNAEEILEEWSRFIEFTSLLSTPLFAVASVWDKPQGKLRKVFKSEEIKHFVRTVFPGSKHKSTVLNMIQ